MINPFYQLNAWYHQPLGVEIAKAIKKHLYHSLSDLFGYYLLQVGIVEQQNWLEDSHIKNRIIITDYPEQATSVVGQAYELPFANESFDVVLLPHTLEMTDKPLAVLEEAYRVLTARGRLFIIGFKPLSLWRILRVLRGKTNPPFSGRLNHIWQVHKNLKQTGFTAISVEEFFYNIPTSNKKVLEKYKFLETLGEMVWLYPGCCYLIVAKKEVSQLQLIRPIWQLKKYIVGKRLQLPDIRTRTFLHLFQDIP